MDFSCGLAITLSVAAFPSIRKTQSFNGSPYVFGYGATLTADANNGHKRM